ncbi:MAG TPA: alpha-hydroxy acid oxidase [Gaiellaceae bacterium]|nr:alpha-hydroxy acid oxidase [Gaiellaceae bacterium]
MPEAEQLVNVFDYEAAAASRLGAGPLGYFAGGAGDELTLRENVAAYGRYRLRPRVLVDVADCTTRTTVLGHDVSMPLLVAPVAFQRLVHPDGEVATARAARDAGTIMCLSTIATASPAEVAATGAPRWFQLYAMRDEGLTHELIGKARDCGYSALLLTVDAPVPGRRERDRRTAVVIPPELKVASLGRGDLTPADVLNLVSPSLTWSDVERIAAEAGLPLLLKGVQTPEDAQLACEHGAAGIVVSNHGGRQLDGVAATIDLLAEIVDAVGGRVEVLVDGGVRRGTDVVKALALGARAVLAGRAALWGLAVDGEAGVRAVLSLLQAEIRNALELLGCRSPADLTAAHVARS